MSRPDAQACSSCRWWDHIEAVGFSAECRRFPPVPSWRLGQNGIDFSQGSWPVTWGHDWCGEFAPPRDEQPGEGE